MEATAVVGMRLSEHLSAVPDGDREQFARMVQTLQAAASPGKIGRLTEFLGKLRKEIDDINSRRSLIGEDLDLVEREAAKIRKRLAECPDSPELSLTLSFLQNASMYLRAEIEEQRPDNKLAKKADVQRRITFLTETQRAAQALCDALAQANGKGA